MIVKIPQEIDGYTVTRIGEDAFRNQIMEELVIPAIR